MMVLTCGNLGELTFYYSEHLTDREEDSTCKLILIIHFKPVAYHVADVGLNDLRDRQLREVLFF